ncbi:MAG: hypothetical protein QF566_01135 [Candidatus Thalassarchaeaceae archaeon]|jgi:hypothetical protein|nr:hypothetical protein [Candidatus Thalassarchaeaceae archaeon]
MKQRPKKKRDPTGPIKPWAALMTWLILNLIWFALSPMGTPQPVLSEDGGYRENYDMNVPDVMGASLPFEVICEVSVSDSNYDNIKIRWTLWDKEKRLSLEELNGDNAYSPQAAYFGDLDNCSKLSETIPPGGYELEIRFYDENETLIAWEAAAEIIEGEFSMMYWVYAPHVVTGYIIANVLGLIILLTDQAFRRWKRAKILARKLPMHKQRHKEEWHSLHKQMEGGGDAAIESFEIELGGSSEAREEMRKRFAESTDDTEEDILPEEEIDDDDKLGKGDISKLRGKAKVDKNIKVVGDLWKRMKDDDDDDDEF